MPDIKRFIPYTIKRFVKTGMRYGKDLVNGDLKKMDLDVITELQQHLVKSIELSIKGSSSAEAKKINLCIAAGKINGAQIGPGQIFSFWRMVGLPSHKKGFQKSRSIKGDQLQEETGGGLCQLSGLVYYLALHAGMTILERHPHSLDIYREEERFAPLGSDATVVYGYKDLRLLNPFDFSLSFKFLLSDNAITGQLFSEWPMEPNEVEFIYTSQNGYTEVQTRICKDGLSHLLATTLYKKLSSLA